MSRTAALETYRVVPRQVPGAPNRGWSSSRPVRALRSMTGIGAHEVVIEAPRTPPHWPPSRRRPSRRAPWRSASALLDLKKIALAYVLVFQNKGGSAPRSSHHTPSSLRRPSSRSWWWRSSRAPPVLPDQGAMRLVRHAAAGNAARRPPPHPRGPGIRGAGPVRAPLSVRDMDPAVHHRAASRLHERSCAAGACSRFLGA